MNADELATLTAVPIHDLGMSFYFDPLTKARGKELGLNVYEFYGLGRAGTLGDVDTATVTRAFTFFDLSTIDFLWTNAKTKADPVDIAREHLRAAYEFADRTFGGVDVTVLADFRDAARFIVDAQPWGVCALLDGYRQFPAPSDPVHGAYFGAILLRELRGGLHIRAVNEVDLDAVSACYLQDPAVFTLHGYKADDAPVVTEELREKKLRAEELTNTAVASAFDVLSDAQRASLAKGTAAMIAALGDPVPVAR
ncbi:MAG: helix-turn-helix domain-containing protein [Acidimicrobiales bacterium]